MIKKYFSPSTSFIFAAAFATIFFLTGCIDEAALEEAVEGAPANQAQTEAQAEVRVTDIARDEEKLQEFLKLKGVKIAMERLVVESGGGSMYDCHQEAHNIGRIGYTIHKEAAFGACNASCHSGCYHGAMESFLHEKGTDDLAANIERVCALFDTTFGIFECLHGVGHGVLAYIDYDVPEGLKQCGKLNTTFAQASCYGGLFMENILTGQGLGASKKADHQTDWVNKTDPHFPCNAISKDYLIQEQCYLMQTSWMLTINSYDFDKVAPLCLEAAPEMVPVCYKSFGRDAAGHTLRNPQKIVEICTKVPATKDKDYREQCATGAVNVIVDFWGPGLKGQATELCKLFQEPWKKACYQTLASRLADVFGTNKAARTEICNGFEESYKNLCVGMADSGSPINLLTPPPQASKDTENSGGEDTNLGANLPEQTIMIKDGKYSPTTLTLKKGQTVRFVNNDTELHWPASNIHPSHSIYPEFDPKGGIAPGDSWAFTFGKKGSWRFHDHLFPDLTGVITVE